MATTLPDNDLWQEIVVPTPDDASEEGSWGVILNEQGMQRLTNRAYYNLRRLEELNGGVVTGITAKGLAALAGVNPSLTPSEGTLLTYSSGQWDAVAPSTGTSVTQAGSTTLNELLTENQQSFETGTTGWVADRNCTISQTSAQARTGSNSLLIQSIAAGLMDAETLTGLNGIPCVAGEVYTTSVYSRAQSAGRDVSVGFVWFDGAGATLSSSFGTPVANNSTGWTQVTHQATAPTNAAFFAISVLIENTGAANEQHYIDDASVKQVLVARGTLSYFGSVLDDATNDAIKLYSGGGRRIAVTADYTVLPNDDGSKIEVDTTSGAVTVTLPSGYRDGLEVNILKVAGGNDVTVTAAGTLNGASGTITGINTGLRVYVTGATTWRALPFSGGGIGSLVQASSAPTDGTWLACDGSVYLQSTYPDLFDKIGLIYDTIGTDIATTGGALSGGDFGGSFVKENAFDNNNFTNWGSSQTGAAIINAAWIGNDLGSKQPVSRIEFRNSSSVDVIPATIDIQGADDAAFTLNVVTRSALTGMTQAVSSEWGFDILPFSRRYVRAIAKAQTPSGSRWIIAEMRIFSSAYSYNSTTEFIVPRIENSANPFYIKAAN